MAGRHRVRHGAVGSFRALLAIGEYRALFGAECLSTAGDQLARIALAALVFARSGSSALTAATYAVTYLPWLVGAPLSGLGDRFPRRRVMVAADMIRAVLAAALAVPGLPLPVLLVLVFLLTAAEPPFRSARAALLPDLLGDEHYLLGHSLNQTVVTAVSVLGFAVGGLAVATVGSSAALLLDAGTFAVSALILTARVPALPLLRPARSERARGGVRLVLADRRARWLVGLAAGVAAVDVVPTGLAIPWAHQLGHGAAAAGLLAAAGPVGTAAVSLVLARFASPATRLRLLPVLALTCVAALVPAVLGPGMPGALLLLVVGGLGLAFQVVANQLFVLAVPAGQRAAAFGVAAATLMVSQGAGVALGGLAADRVAPSTVVGLGGAGGVVLVLALLARRPDLRGLLDASLHGGQVQAPAVPQQPDEQAGIEDAGAVWPDLDGPWPAETSRERVSTSH